MMYLVYKVFEASVIVLNIGSSTLKTKNLCFLSGEYLRFICCVIQSTCYHDVLPLLAVIYGRLSSRPELNTVVKKEAFETNKILAEKSEPLAIGKRVDISTVLA